MFDMLNRLYNEGKLTAAGLDNAVKKGWITQQQATEIKGDE